MILFFNIDNLELEAKGDPYKLVSLLSDLYYKRLPKNASSKPKRKLSGLSFIINPEKILNYSKSIDIYYIIQYIKLAAYRDYSHYKYYGSKSLQLSYYPDINLDNIKTNPLLKITQTEIFFLYEENT